MCNIFILTVVIISFLFGAQAQASGKKICTQDEAIAAETEASILKDWDSVYQSFKRFSHCDDGAIAEGYDEVTARLLAEDWKHISRLDKLVSRDKRFEKFLLHHIGEVMTSEQEQKIYQNIDLHCLPKQKRLCEIIKARLDETKPIK